MQEKGGHGSRCHCPCPFHRHALRRRRRRAWHVRGLSLASPPPLHPHPPSASPPLCALIPVSTPRAVAHGSGWGCCGDSCCCCGHRSCGGHGCGCCGCGCGRHHGCGCLILLPLAVSCCRRPRRWSSSPGPVVVGVGVGLSRPMVLLSWFHFLFVAAAHSDGVRVAIVVGASPSSPVVSVIGCHPLS
jgi:hypothetical protein